MRILCYGDSNTWGYNPVNAMRYSGRWTRILAGLLPDDEIIEEGLNGRTFRKDDPTWPGRNGYEVLPVLLRTHRPVDLVIVMLGSNDLKVFHQITLQELISDLEATIDVIRDENLAVPYEVPDILVVSPVTLGSTITTTSKWAEFFTEDSYRISQETGRAFRKVSQEKKTFFFDASEAACASSYDGLHLDEENHKKLAEAIALEIKGIKEKMLVK